MRTPKYSATVHKCQVADTASYPQLLTQANCLRMAGSFGQTRGSPTHDSNRYHKMRQVTKQLIDALLILCCRT